jgi:hypothetical protein
MEFDSMFGLNGLADLRVRSGNDMRPELLRVLTDLYVQRLSHSADEERHYTELALRMLQAVDVPTRAFIAKRFARYLSPPLQVLHRLAGDVPQVAGELRDHPLLQPPTSAIATTSDAAPAAVTNDAWLDTGERSTAPDTAPSASELNDLFFTARAEERRLILLNLDVIAADDAAQEHIAADPSISTRLELAALAGDREGFARQLADALQIPHAQARRITHDNLGEPIVIAAKVLSMPREVLYRILMFINPVVGHSVERVHALAALYDELTVPAAVSMLAIWQAPKRQEPAGAKHRPLMWDDETRHRARPGTAAQLRGPAVPRAGERRNAS